MSSTIDKLLSYGNQQYAENKVGGKFQKVSGSKSEAKTDKTAGMSVVKKHTNEIKQPELSASAQNLLEKLKKTYDDKMDFMVYDEGQDPKDLLPYATKEYTVLFSAKELEKMAADENYEKENMDKVLSAIDELNDIGTKTGIGSEDNKDGGQITRIGISFNDDGTVKLFADLEKMTVQQNERMEKIRQKRAEEKRAAEKAEEKKESKDKISADKKETGSYRNKTVKRVTVEADSAEELIEKITGIDWDKINEELKPTGKKLNIKA